MMDQQWRLVRKLLAVRLDNLGDVLVTTPAIHALRSSLPEATITLLASPAGAQAARLNPDIDEVILHEAPWVDPWQRIAHDPIREQKLIERLRAERFDAAVIFTSFRQSPLPAAYLAYLAGIPLRLGATTDAAGSLLSTRHKYPECEMHEVERGLNLVATVGCSTDVPRLVLNVPAGCLRDAESNWQLWQEGQRRSPRVVVHPGSSMPARMYPWELYAETVNMLVERLAATVLVTGREGEGHLVGRIVDGLSLEAKRQVLARAGDLTFPEFCASIATADLAITNNTGPMHVAAAVGTPVVCLFALTNPPQQWEPWRVPHRILNHDVSCRICYQRICPFNQECLRSVTPAETVDAAEALLFASSPELLAESSCSILSVSGVRP